MPVCISPDIAVRRGNPQVGCPYICPVCLHLNRTYALPIYIAVRRGNPQVGCPYICPVCVSPVSPFSRSQALPGNEGFEPRLQSSRFSFHRSFLVPSLKEGMSLNTDCSRGGIPDWWRQSLLSSIPRQSLGTRNKNTDCRATLHMPSVRKSC